jgi:hypothetical protein
MSNGSLSDRVAALRVLASLEELVDASVLWTGFISGGSPIDSKDRKALLELATRMNELLTTVPAALRVIDKIAKNNPKSNSPAIESFVQALTAEEQESIKRRIGSKRGYAAALIAYTAKVRATLPAERKTLRQQSRRFAQGTQTITAAPARLLSHEFICGICAVVIVAAILTQNEFAYRWAYNQAVAEEC